MTRLARALASMATALAVIVAAAGCGSSAANDSGKSSGDVPSLTVYVGSPNILFAQQWVAQGAGLFKKHGVEVKLGNPNAGAVGPSALVAGQADVLVTGIGSGLATVAQGRPVKVIYGLADFDWRAHTLAARKGIQSIDELKALGSKCRLAGATPGTGTYGIQVHVMKDLGLDCKVQTFAQLPDILTAVASGQADFGLVPPSLAATAADKVSILFDPTTATDAEGTAFFPTDIVSTAAFVTEKTIKDKAEALKRYLAALNDAYDLIQSESPEELAAQVIKVKDAFGTVDPKSMATQFKLQKPIFRDGDISEDEWKAMLTAFADFKAPSVDPGSDDQSYPSVVDLDLLNASRK